MEKKRIAVIRIKGDPGLKANIRRTFKLLKLYKKNHLVIIPNTPEYIGMLNKIKDASTWGEIDRETFELLLEKRGKLPGKESLKENYLKEKNKMNFEEFSKNFMEFKIELKDVPGLKTFFKLSPPRHGFEKEGLKAQFAMGGALGYRKNAVNDLIKRMV